MRATLQGVDGRIALFDVDGKGVLVNTRSLTASLTPLEVTAVSRFWVAPEPDALVSTWEEVARCAIPAATNDVTVLAAGSANRAYTVPRNVVRHSASALDRRRFTNKRGTPAALLAATLLTENKQVTLRDVAHVARFFANNEDLRPTLTWDLWGGDSGSRWAQGIVAKTSEHMLASADLEVNLLSFYEGDDDERTFLGQMSSPDLQNDEVSALFRRTPEAGWQLWFNGDWEPTPKPDVPDSLLAELDDDAAVYVAGALYDAPDSPVSLRDFNPEEWDLAAAAINGIDQKLINHVMVAAPPPDGSPGDYTPEERSENASGQLRDANGRFAKVGDQGLMKSGLRGTIKTLNPVNNEIIVDAEDGNSYSIPPKDFEIDSGGATRPAAPGATKSKLPPLNLDAILGQPRATKTTPKAWLPRLLQPMGPGQLKKVLDNYEEFIKKERLERAGDFKGGTGWDESGPAYNSPLLRKRKKPVKAAGDEAALADDDSPDVEKLTPETTDVKPLYLAIVDRDDPQAVTALVAMIPASDADSTSTTYRRVGGAWVEDTKLLQDLKSPTPPPVVQLDEQMYQDVLNQVDNAQPDESEQPPPETPPAVAASVSFEPEVIPMWGPNAQVLALITAAGGVDRNRGNAEALRRYWLHGPGALKIRWGTGGDWKRCVRLLSKHLGPRAKGYCALRHKEATGMWTGDRKHRQLYGSFPGERIFSTREEIRSTRQIVASAIDEAKVRALKARVYGQTYPGATQPEDIPQEGGGRRFKIPLLIPEGLESGDGRTFDIGSLGMRTLPLPLMWQIKTGEGHDGSVLVGRMDRVERTPDGLGNVTGVFDTGPFAQEAERLVANKMLRWVSVDLDRFEAEEVEPPDDDADELAEGIPKDDNIKQPKLKIKKGRLMGGTLVMKPAFQEVTIELEPEFEMTAVQDGTYVGEPVEGDVNAVLASGSIAASIPVEPPRVWFNRPVLNGPTAIQVTNEGQVFGHIATWETSHIGLPGSTRAPRSASQYAYFHTGVLRTDDGEDVGVGQLTLAGGHASMEADATAAVRHYDDTGSAIADVKAGEDSYGIWVAGALRPGTTPEQIRALRASAPSGDWRSINNRLELVAICQVNVPGFPVVRSQVASGAITSLVAAGTSTLARMHTDPVAQLDERVKQLEKFELRQERKRARAALARMKPALDERKESQEQMRSLAAAAQARVFKVLDVDGYLTEFKDFSSDKRDDLAKKGHALKDGSFPIENVADLRRAVRAYGRTTDDKKVKVRRHIVKRARALGKSDLIPDNWGEASITDDALRARDAREVLTAAALERRAAQIRSRVK